MEPNKKITIAERFDGMLPGFIMFIFYSILSLGFSILVSSLFISLVSSLLFTLIFLSLVFIGLLFIYHIKIIKHNLLKNKEIIPNVDGKVSVDITNKSKIYKMASLFDKYKFILIILNGCLLSIYQGVNFFFPSIPYKYLEQLFSYKTLIFLIVFYYLYFIFISRNEKLLMYLKVLLLFLLVGFLIHPFVFLFVGLLIFR